MTYASMVPEVREALGVAASHDASILTALTRNARFLLRRYSFPKAYRTSEVVLTPTSTGAPFPADMGKFLNAVLIQSVGGVVAAYKELRRREAGHISDPAIDTYSVTQSGITFNRAFDETGYSVLIYYRSNDPVYAEAWLTAEFRDVLLHRTLYEIAPSKNKPDVQQIYASYWQEDMQDLGIYLHEEEFQGMDLRMSPVTNYATARYPST